MHINVDVKYALLKSEKLNNAENNVVDIAKAACFALFGVMQTAGPIDCYVSFSTIQTGSPFHAPTGANRTEFEKSVKDRTVISNIEFGLLFRVGVHVVWCDLLQKLDIFVGVELCHFEFRGWLCAVDLHLFVHPVVHHKTVCHPDSVGFHRMTSNICVIPHVGIVEICHSFLVAASSIEVRSVDWGKESHNLCE